MHIFSDISIWWIIPLGILSIAISYFYYNKQSQLSEIKKRLLWGLVALRSIVLFLLFTLLLALVIESKDYKKERPLFITMIDNSSSMKNYSDSSIIESSIDKLKKDVEDNYGERFDLQFLTVNNDVQTDSNLLTFTGQESNLEKGFEFIYNQYYNRNIGGIALVSDGNFNTGMNPVYAAEKISLTPIFTIGVGDTVVKRDQFISNVSVNNVAFYKNDFPIEVDLKAYKLKGANSKLLIKSNGKVIESRDLTYDTANDFQNVSFTLNANSIGFVQYSIELEGVENESSYENNVKTFYVEVIDSRNNILFISKAPHPDIAAISQEIEKDENTELNSILIDDWNGKLDGVELLIWHNPDVSQAESVLSQVNKKRIPVLYIVPTNAASSAIDKLNIGLHIPKGRQTDEVQGIVNDGFQLFGLSDELKKSLKKWPPLVTKFGSITFSNGEVLLNQQIGSVVKKDPILFFGNRSGNKYGVIIGEGLWRWRMEEYAASEKHSLFNELVQKTTQYLTVKKNTDPLRVKLPKRFRASEEVIINAEFYNSSFEQINDPDIELELINELEEKIDYSFAKNDKDYKLSIGKLTSGSYKWNARCKYNGKVYEKSGVFVVDNLSIEAMNTHANHNLLQQISSNSSGKFYNISDLSVFMKDLNERKDIVTVSYEESSFDDLIDWKWICFLIVLLLGVEWFIRRYSGSY